MVSSFGSAVPEAAPEADRAEYSAIDIDWPSILTIRAGSTPLTLSLSTRKNRKLAVRYRRSGST